jgi:hypothetical protein
VPTRASLQNIEPMARSSLPKRLQLYRWRMTRIRGTPAEQIGYVEAPDEATAIKAAIEQYGITDPQKQSRLVAVRVK